MNMKYTLLFLIVAAIAIAAGSWLSSNQKTAKEEAIEAARENFSNIQGNILSPARKISVPRLQKHDGTAFTGEELQGHWSLVFFGFAHCSEICPVTMSMLAQAKKLAENQKLDFPQVYFISVDQERDDLQGIGKFVGGFDKAFTGVTGDPKMIKALSLQMNVIYMPAEQAKDVENYQIDHSSALLLLNPQGSLKAFLNPPHTPEKILKDISTVIKAEE
ncbi:MAG: SCO family protein [Gammaproteobacteria bacterium]|nr:MAG: SCO family protein [Gammaproteobacteria bacterium]